MVDKKLETLAYRLRDLSALRNLFSELNFDFVDKPVNKDNWNDEQKRIVQEAKIIASKDDYQIYYIQTNTDSLKEWKGVSSKIIKDNNGLCMICSHNPSGFKWVFSSLSKDFSKSFSETRHVPIDINPDTGIPNTFVEFLEKIKVGKDSTSTSIASQISNAFDSFAVKIHDELTVNVFEALKVLSEGIVGDKNNNLSLTDEILEEIREPIFILLYRIIFILYAEDRGIFPVDNKIYQDEFSLKWIKEKWLLKSVNTKQLAEYDVEKRVKKLFRLIEIGSEELDYDKEEFFMRSYYGRIFDRKINHKLEGWNIPNSNFLEMLSLLTRTRDKKGNYFFLDYSALETRHLGSIYEHLLEFHLHVKNKKIAELPDVKERKATGSYYTPKYVVDYTVKNSLEPVIESIIEKNPDKQLQIEKILSLNILDPAMGSGHFLVGAVEYMAKRICEIEFGEVSEQTYIERKRDVVRQCIYGVDINPLAVDLAKLSLWLETLSSEKPLSFLSAHIKCGNSLVGTEIETIFEKQTTLFESEKRRRGFRKNVKKFLMFENLEDDSSSTVKMKLEEYNKMQSKGTIYYDLKFLLDSKISEYYGIKIPNLGDYRAKIGENSLDFYTEDNYQSVKKLSEQMKFFHWELEFPQIFYDENGEKKENSGFDIVIGNPPYFQLQKNKKISENLSYLQYKTYSKSSDIYCIFYEQGVNLLKNEGMLAYMTSNSWMKTKYGLLLRKYLKEYTNPLTLIVFENSQVFDEAIVESNILILEKNVFQNNLKALNFNKTATKYEDVDNHFTNNHVTLNNLDDNGWIISDKSSSLLRRKVENDSTPLKELNLKIYIGLLNGYNDAFVIDSKTKNELIKQDPKSREIIQQMLRGRDVGKYYLNWQDTWLINSHNGIKDKFPRIDVPKDFPAVYNHLSHFKEPLKIRYNQGSHWTNLRNCVYFNEFKKPKIIWGELSDLPKFAFDDKGFVPEATLFAMVGDNLKYLLGILNSKTALWYFEQISTSSGMGTNRWKKYKIEQLPIKNSNKKEMKKITIVVDKIITITNSNNYLSSPEKQAQVSQLEHNLDKLVYNLYNLSLEEIKIIENTLN